MIQHAYSPHARKAWVSHFLQCQYDSYKHFLNTGLKESFGTFRTRLREDAWAAELMFEFLPEFYKIKPPAMTLTQCLKLRRSWLGVIFIPLKIRWRPNSDTGLKPRVYVIWFALVQCPLMTRHGHFIVRGVPRVVLSQMVRRAGVYFRSKPDRRGRLKSSVVDIIAARGTWLRLEVKAKKRDMLSRKRSKTRISSSLGRLRHVYVHMPAQPNLPFFSFLRCLGLRPGRFHSWIRGVLRQETKTWLNYGGHSLTSSKRQSHLFGPHIRYEVRFEDRDFLHLNPNPRKEQQTYQRFVRMSDVKKVKPGLLWLSDYAAYLGDKKHNPLFANHPLWTRRWRRWSLFHTEAAFKQNPALDMVYHTRSLNQSSCFWGYDEIHACTSQNWILRACKHLQPYVFQRQNRHGVRPDTFLGEFPSVIEKLFPEMFQYSMYHTTYDDVITSELFGPMFYDLGRDGRKHMNEILGLKTPGWVRTLTSQDILFSAYYLLASVSGNAAPETNTDHLQHKVLKPVGTLLQQVMLLGLIELKREVTRRFKSESPSKPTLGWKRPRASVRYGRFPSRRKVKMLKYMVALPTCDGSEDANRQESLPSDVHNEGKDVSKAGLLAHAEARTTWQGGLGFERYIQDAFKGQRQNVAAHEAYANPYLDPEHGKDQAYPGQNHGHGRKTQNLFLRLGPLYGLKQELSSVFHTVPFNKALRRFFGTNPLSQFLDETNAISELTHKRRLSFMGLGGLDRYNATMDVRSIHPSHYGRICPIETPEGQNAGLVHSLTCFAHVNQSHLLSPFFPIYKTWVETRQVVKKRLDVYAPIVPGDVLMSRHHFQRLEPLPYRHLEIPGSGPAETAGWNGVSQRQVLSLATSCIPFMEHNDGNRALMGSNMQRQAVALVSPQSPIVAAGMESKINAQSYSSKQARQGGRVVYVDASRVLVLRQSGKKGHHAFPPGCETLFRHGKALSMAHAKQNVAGLRSVKRRLVHQKQSFARFQRPSDKMDTLFHPASFPFPLGRSQIERVLKRMFVTTGKLQKVEHRFTSQSFMHTRLTKTHERSLKAKQDLDLAYLFFGRALPLPQASKAKHQPRPPIWNQGLAFKPTGLEKPPFTLEPWFAWKACLRKAPPVTLPRGQAGRLTTTERHRRADLEPRLGLKIQTIRCTSFMGCNQHTYRLQRPCVAFGAAVRQGGFVTNNASSSQGALSLGQNLMVGYTPWQGYNFEDAILMNQRLVVEDVLTSLHIEHYDIHAKHLRRKKKAEGKKPALSDDELETGGPEFASRSFQASSTTHCSNGVLKPGSWVTEGDAFLFKWRYAPVEDEEQRSLLRLLKIRPPLKDRSLTVPWQIYGRIIDVHLKTKPIVADPQVQKVANAPTSHTSSFTSEKPNLPHGRHQTAKLIFWYDLRIQKWRWSKRQLKPHYGFQMSQRRSFAVHRTKSNPPYPHGQGFRARKRTHDPRQSGLHLGASSVPNASVHQASPQRCTGWFLGPKAELARFVSPGYKRWKHRPYARHLYGNETLRFTLATPRRIQVGDKLSGRHGNKGIVSRVLPSGYMPFCPDGTPLDLAFNPLGVPSRMNVGQLFECLLGFAGGILKQHFVVPSFGATYGAQISRSLSYTKLYEARLKTGQSWLFNPNFPGKVRCFDGRTGQAFLNPISVGKPYILKLIHCVEEKLHARNTGPYNIVTQQPLRGRRRKGGQRVGEMEVWALEGFGAAYVLHELLNVKSDSMVGRDTVESHILTRSALTWDNPESFKLLAHECQSLGFEVSLFHRNKYHKTKIQNQTYLF